MDLAVVNIVLGIFSICAFTIVAVLLKKYQLPWRSWITLAMVVVLLTVYRHGKNALGEPFHSGLYTIAMIFMAFVALGQFWGVMRLTG